MSLRVHWGSVRRHLMVDSVGHIIPLVILVMSHGVMHLHVAVAGAKRSVRNHRRVRPSRRRHHHHRPVRLATVGVTLRHGHSFHCCWLRVSLDGRRRRIAGSGGLHLRSEIVAAAILRSGHGATVPTVVHHHHILARISTVQRVLVRMGMLVLLSRIAGVRMCRWHRRVTGVVVR